MGIEIERKFLVQNEQWRAGIEGELRIVQGYLANNYSTTVRVRIQGEQAYLTLKGPTRGISRTEFEYSIPLSDAEFLLRDQSIAPPIEKTRYLVRHDADLWELDVFAGANAGLVLAEIELEQPDQAFTPPEWLGAEVTADARYYNINLARHPFLCW